MKRKKVIALIGIVLSCNTLMVGCSAYDFDNDTSTSDSADFSSYLIDVRSWAYNYNFAPDGNSASASDLTAIKGYKDMKWIKVNDKINVVPKKSTTRLR
ncbi:hypothetical protein [Lactobacillus johnsonii]|uniref:Lipoprotein n=1 Tax=Lactobacillus johnsonii TaxID=33959 RepID=A0A9X7T7K3_LACJH|nr:hypothetical protein [Lactobacillus johnsonii]QIA88491.1 hypothetical protein FEE39_09585 [Lactobacillus johnsonii]